MKRRKADKKKKQKMRRSQPKMLELDDHALMEKLFGKRVVKKLDQIAAQN